MYFKHVFISIKEQIKLFDSLGASVLKYGSEVWGYDKCRDIDIVHNKFCRYILCVKKSTNVDAMYGDLGRLALSVFRKLRMIKVRGPFVQTLCIEKDSYMDAI